MFTKLYFERSTKVFFFLFFFYSAVFSPVIGTCQEYHLANSFGVEQGLPSNHIYEICQDKKGFLWITTDNGVSRFDGKNFYNYSVKNGLPSNDVLQVAMESDGTIWVSCYKETPSYFDEKNNRFVSFNENTEIANISSVLLKFFVLPDQGIRFFGDLGYVDFVYKKPKIISKDYSYGFVRIDGENYDIKNSAEFNDKRIGTDIIELYQNEKRLHHIDSLSGDLIFNRLIREDRFLAFKKDGEVVSYSNFKVAPYSFVKKRIKIPETLKWFSFSKKYLCIIAVNGNLYFYNLKTFQFAHKIVSTDQTNSAFIDKDENLWIGTVDNGLKYYNLSRIETAFSDESSGNNLFSVSQSTGNKIMGGNHRGEILSYSRKEITKQSIKTELKELWVRKIIHVNNTVFAFSDDGYSTNLSKIKPIYWRKTINSTSIKSAFLLNKNTIIIGSTMGLFSLSTKNETQKQLRSPMTRFLNFGKIDDHSFYCINAEGVIHYNFEKESIRHVNYPKSKQNKPCALSICKNNLFWLATVKGDLLLLKNEKVINKITTEQGLPENITNLLWLDTKLWIASKTGLYILDFKLINNKLKYVLNKLSKSDGLSSNVINDLCSDLNFVYAATDRGFSIVPRDIHFPKFNIVPNLNSIRINNKKVLISQRYLLHEEEKNVVLNLSGPELSGHFKNFQYAFNNEKRWIDLDGNSLNLTLKGGENNIVIRSVDVNNNLGHSKLRIDFVVAIPFYNKLWFWVLIVFALTALIFWLYNRRKLNKQTLIFKQKLELEQQRNKITADLHDDIGSTLSSLQINSSVANQMIDKNPALVKSVLIKIESQAENLAEKIGDIIWSMKPGKEEFITLSMRIKNFANDILGSTNIFYKINTNPLVDSLIQDITMRKNIVLFFKEAINNSAKYSQATNITISLDYKKNIVYLEIKDNGIGFDNDKKLGNGLSNMRKRIEELNGVFFLETKKAEGTKITATIPLK